MWLWRLPVRLRISTLIKWQTSVIKSTHSLEKRVPLYVKITLIIKDFFFFLKKYDSLLESFFKFSLFPKRCGVFEKSTHNLYFRLVPKYTNFINYSSIEYPKQSRKPSTLNKAENSPNKQLFQSFITLNCWVRNKNLKIHKSYKSYYFYDNDFNLGIFNLKKVFAVWINITGFIKNLIFYRNTYVAFGNSYFKYEILSINHLIAKDFFIWRYVSFFVFFINNKTTPHLEYYFSYLLDKNVRLSFIIDIFYHKKWFLGRNYKCHDVETSYMYHHEKI